MKVGKKIMEQLINHSYEQLPKNYVQKPVLTNITIPKTIKSLIFFTKVKYKLINLLSFWTCFLLSLFLINKYTHFLTKLINKIGFSIQTDYLNKYIKFISNLSLGWIITAIVISFLVLVFYMINSYQFKIQTKRYQKEILINQNPDFSPFFIIKKYKSLIQKPYYVNYLCSSAYILIATSLVIYTFYLISLWFRNTQEHILIVFKSNVIGYWIGLIVLIIVVSYHIFALLSVKLLKGNFESAYNRSLLSEEEILKLKKTANRRSLIVLIITIAISLSLIFFFILFFKIERRKVNFFARFKK
ncbi:MSC_0882 family membrane protein [Mycoplasma leachii]|uniref:MSC_0882 family membrane protein n=1 Tax=Mycoplasma leachii TaxID=2105 RepID=UPI003DA2E0AC